MCGLQFFHKLPLFLCTSKSADPYNIQPKLDETSRRVTGYSEADRLSKYASEIFVSNSFIYDLLMVNLWVISDRFLIQFKINF